MQSPTYKSEVGNYVAQVNIIGFGLVIVAFMLAFSAFSVLACYKTIPSNEDRGIFFLALAFAATAVFLVIRVIPGCIRHWKSELIGEFSMEADGRELRIIKQGADIERVLWSDFQGVGIGTYYIGCKAIVIEGRRTIAFGTTLSLKSKYEICEWITEAYPKQNKKGA